MKQAKKENRCLDLNPPTENQIFGTKLLLIFSKSTKFLLDLLDLDTNIEIFGKKAGKPVSAAFLVSPYFFLPKTVVF